MSYSLYLHAKQLQQCCEDAHVVQQENVVPGPVEDIHLCVTLIEHSWRNKPRSDDYSNQMMAE